MLQNCQKLRTLCEKKYRNFAFAADFNPIFGLTARPPLAWIISTSINVFHISTQKGNSFGFSDLQLVLKRYLRHPSFTLWTPWLNQVTFGCFGSFPKSLHFLPHKPFPFASNIRKFIEPPRTGRQAHFRALFKAGQLTRPYAISTGARQIITKVWNIW